MAPLTDRILYEKIVEALREWDCDGFIQWKRRPADWLRRNLEGWTQKGIGEAMHAHALSGGEIDQVKENYEGYRDSHPYHYDFRIMVGDRRIYIETVFDEMKMGPTVTIVNLKDA